jgi:signal peptidase II
MRILLYSFFVVVVDQLTKLFVKGFSFPFSHKGFGSGKTFPIIENRLMLTYVENPGIAFGMYFGPVFKVLCSVVSLAAVAGIIYYFSLKRDDSFIKKISLALIAGGAFGNVIDRIFYGVVYNYAAPFFGRVVDFIDIRLNFFPGGFVCNVADIAIFFGLLLLVLADFKSKKAIPGIASGNS